MLSFNRDSDDFSYNFNTWICEIIRLNGFYGTPCSQLEVEDLIIKMTKIMVHINGPGKHFFMIKVSPPLRGK